MAVLMLPRGSGGARAAARQLCSTAWAHSQWAVLARSSLLVQLKLRSLALLLASLPALWGPGRLVP
jgi:hypothetical protein